MFLKLTVLALAEPAEGAVMRRRRSGRGCGARGLGDYAPQALGRRRGTRKQVYAVCAKQTAMPPAIRPAARSLLMVGATHSRVGDGSAARSAARRRNDTAMERRGAQAFSDRKEGPRRKAHVWALRGAPFPRHAPGVEDLSPPRRGGKAGHPGPLTTAA